MDGGFRGLESDTDSTLVYDLESQSNVQSWNEFSTDTTLRLESPGTSIMYASNSKVTKRKSFDFGETKDQKIASQPLVFGNSLSSLGSSKRSSTTMCTKFPPKDCSMGLKLNFQIHRGGDDMASSKNPSVTARKEIRIGIDLTLHLSLPDKLSESAATGITTASQYECISEKAVAISEGPTADDASKSTFWIYGSSSSSYLTTLEIPPKAKPIESPDLSSSKTEAPSKPVTGTSVMVVQRQKRSNSAKNCEAPGCVEGARGASGLCIAHGGGWRCKKDGCHEGAEGKTIYCKAQGGGRRCQQLGCPERRTDLSIAHGGGRRCTYEGCKRGARGTSDFCIKHGGGKRCQTENCTRSAEGKFGRCVSHGGGRRCLYPACTKGAQGRTMLCKAHRGGKRCSFPECTKGAEGSTPFCKGHGGGKRCTFEGGCSKSVTVEPRSVLPMAVGRGVRWLVVRRVLGGVTTGVFVMAVAGGVNLWGVIRVLREVLIFVRHTGEAGSPPLISWLRGRLGSVLRTVPRSMTNEFMAGQRWVLWQIASFKRRYPVSIRWKGSLMKMYSLVRRKFSDLLCLLSVPSCIRFQKAECMVVI